MNSISPRVKLWLLIAAAAALGLLWRLEFLRDAAFIASFRWPIGLESGFYAIGGVWNGLEPEGCSILYRRLLEWLVPGLSVAWVRALQLGVNYIGVWVLWDLLKRDDAISPAIRRVMLALALIYPVPFSLQCELLPQSLLFPFAAAALWFFRRGGGAFAGAAGVAAGGMTLLDPLAIGFAVALAALAAGRRFWRKAVWLAAGCAVILAAGWFSPGYGIRFAAGNRPGAGGVMPEFMSGEWCRAAYARDGKALSDPERLARLGSEWLRSPGDGGVTLLRKAGLACFWRDNGREGLSEHLARAVPMVEIAAFLAPFFWLFTLFGIWQVCRRRELHGELDLMLAVAAPLAMQLIFAVHTPLRGGMYAGAFPLAAIGIVNCDWLKYRWWLLAAFVACVGSYLLLRGRQEETLARAEWQLRNGYQASACDLTLEQIRMPLPEFYRISRLRGAALLARSRICVMPYERMYFALDGVIHYRNAWYNDNPGSPAAKLEYLDALEKLNREWRRFTGNASPTPPVSLTR
ncbi:MAG: hypothetical protein PHI35_02390 [Victivallaceae bacterium]|nr:hypothetical protein [Victivallaceae bacterium]